MITPASVSGTAMVSISRVARLDQLDDRAKRTAQTAAVIGRELQLDVLRAVSDAADGIDQPLVTLRRRELIREKGQLLARAFLFKHTLTQETAYGSILMSRRRELHRRVAECL